MLNFFCEKIAIIAKKSRFTKGRIAKFQVRNTEPELLSLLSKPEIGDFLGVPGHTPSSAYRSMPPPRPPPAPPVWGDSNRMVF